MEKIAQCTLECRNLEKFQKTGKNFNFSKCPKNVPKSNQTCLEHASRYFCRWKISPSAPWRVEKSKNFKKLENFQFSKCPNTFPKVFKFVFNMLRGIFSGKKIRLVHPEWSRNRKISKKMKKNQFFKIPKNVSKSVQISSEVIFSELFLTSATWRSKLVEIRKKIEKNWIPKSVLKRS